MNLPKLSDWKPTREALHSAALVLSALGKLGKAQDPHFFHHLALTVTAKGMTTGTTTQGEFLLDFQSARVVYTSPEGSTQTIALSGHSQVSLLETLIRKTGENLEPDLSHITHDDPFDFDEQIAADYIDALNLIQTAFTEFRSTLSDDKTNIVVFPHHFDLSFLWFNGEARNEQQAHMNFGFSPGDETISRPYVYIYAWSGKDYLPLEVSKPLRHHVDFKSGVILAYDDLVASNDPQNMLGDALQQAKTAAQALWG